MILEATSSRDPLLAESAAFCVKVHGVHTNPERGPPVVCYGPDRVHSFLKKNKLNLIVRAHECVMDGFQRCVRAILMVPRSAWLHATL